MPNAIVRAGSSRCLLHAWTGLRPRGALTGLAHSSCGATQVALVSVQPSLNTYLLALELGSLLEVCHLLPA